MQEKNRRRILQVSAVTFDMDLFGDKKALDTMDLVPRHDTVRWTAYRVPAVRSPCYP